jgi:hypothetical protein
MYDVPLENFQTSLAVWCSSNSLGHLVLSRYILSISLAEYPREFCIIYKIYVI